jgi:hypothetical protein
MTRLVQHPHTAACGLRLLVLLLALGSLPRPAQASVAPSPPRVNTQLLAFVVGAGLVTLGAVTAIALATNSARRTPDLQWPRHREPPDAQQQPAAPAAGPRAEPPASGASARSRARSAPDPAPARRWSWGLRPRRGGLMAVVWGEL